jgi:predicted Zn-dependent protease
MLSIGVSTIAARTPQGAAASQEKKETVRPPKAVRRFIAIKTFLAKEMEKDPAFRAGVEEVYRQKLREHSEYAAMVNGQGMSAAALQDKQRFDLLYDNPIVQSYVNRLGQSLTPQGSSRLYAFKVTLNPIPEARSLSTGTIYISSGLLALVDNEAQLAYVLAHEIAHVEREHWKEDVLIEAGLRRYQQHKNRTRRIFAKTLTLLVGPVLRQPAVMPLPGARSDALFASLGGAMGLDRLSGALSSPYIEQGLPTLVKLFTPRAVVSWDRVQEDEADQLALQYVLDRNYDPREAAKFYARLQGASRSDTRAGLGFVADVTRVIERTQQLRTQIATMKTDLDAKPQLLVGAFNLAETLRNFNGKRPEEEPDRAAQTSATPGRRLNLTENAEARLAALSQAMSARTGELIGRIERGELVATGAEFQTVMSDVKRDNGIRAFQFDMFQEARTHLRESLSLNPNNAQARYYHALVLKLTARSAEDKRLALAELTRAVELDQSGLLPEARFERALALLESDGQSQKSEAATMLRQYVELYRKQHEGQPPPNLNRVYEYLRHVNDAAP